MTDCDVQKLIEEFHVPLHVKRHCEAVTELALKLGRKMIAAGQRIDLKNLKCAGLLHDMVRIIDFREFNPKRFDSPVTAGDIEVWKKLREKYKGMHHAVAAAEILKERGYPEIAEIVRKHRFLQIMEGFDAWEEKLLYYADKRVQHDQITPLNDRLLDGRKRNAPETENAKQTRVLDQKVADLEAEIFKKIGENPQ